MSSAAPERVTAFLAAFARRQAAQTRDFDGGFAVRDAAYVRSWEHNQVVVDGDTRPDLLADHVDALLDGLGHRMVTVLSGPLGAACAPFLTARGYTHGTALVMVHEGPRPAPARLAEELTLDDLRTALARQDRVFWPDSDEETIRHLVERRAARLRGADRVRFLGAREADGTIAAWADLYEDEAAGVAQVEDLVTAEASRGRGHARAVLGTAVHRATGDLLFLLADADDWPKEWYTREGFTPTGEVHVFTRQ